jgi:hypothetical protein
VFSTVFTNAGSEITTTGSATTHHTTTTTSERVIHFGQYMEKEKFIRTKNLGDVPVK